MVNFDYHFTRKWESNSEINRRMNIQSLGKMLRKIILPFLIFYSIIKSRTLVYGFALATIGIFLISSNTKVPDFLVLIRLIPSVYFLALATYLYNDLTDYEVDKVNGRDTNLSLKKINYKKILYSTIGFFVISILLAFSINIQTGIGSLAFLGLGIAYSHPRIQLKKIFLVKTIVTAFGGFIASLMGALAVQNISNIGISASIIFFLMYFINGPLGDIGDMNGDKKVGRRTIPIVLGVKKTFRVIFSVISLIVIILIVNYSFFGLDAVGFGLGLVTCTFIAFRIKKLFLQYKDKKKINQTRTLVRFGILTIQISTFIGIMMESNSL